MIKTSQIEEPAKAATHVRFKWERALLHSDLDAHAKALALILATYADAKGLAYPSVATLAKKASLSPVRTRCLLHELAKEKWITITFGGGEGKSNRYWLNSSKDEGVTLPRETRREFVEGTLENNLRFKWEIAVRDSDLNFAQKGMALVLATYETNLVGTPNIKELADSSTRSPRHVQRLLRELTEGGWLQITVRRRHESNVYFLATGQSAKIERRRAPNKEAFRGDTRERGITGVTSLRDDTSDHSEMTPAITRGDTGESQTPLLRTPITTTPSGNFTSSAARKRMSDDKKKIAEAILATCDSILGPTFAKDRWSMKDHQGVVRMISQLLDREVPERAIIHELTEGGYPNFTHPASGMHKRLKDYVDRRHVVDYPVLPVAPNEAVLKMLQEAAETMRAKTNEHLGLRDRKVPTVEYVSCFDLPTSDGEFS
jgi:AraC-like DNA-binding protein